MKQLAKGLLHLGKGKNSAKGGTDISGKLQNLYDGVTLSQMQMEA